MSLPEGHPIRILRGHVAASLVRKGWRPPPRDEVSEAILQDIHDLHHRQIGSDHLTANERMVLSFIAAGYSGPEVAELTLTSPNTVKTKLKRILRKLDVATQAEAVAWAITEGEIAYEPELRKR